MLKILKMNKLKIYLLLAILAVGLIPIPLNLPWDIPEGCNAYRSVFMRAQWKWEGCAIVPRGTVIITVPGSVIRDLEYRTYGTSLFDELLPHLVTAYLDGHIWGSLYEPRLWREETWKLPRLQYQLSPKIQLKWSAE